MICDLLQIYILHDKLLHDLVVVRGVPKNSQDLENNLLIFRIKTRFGHLEKHLMVTQNILGGLSVEVSGEIPDYPEGNLLRLGWAI